MILRKALFATVWGISGATALGNPAEPTHATFLPPGVVAPELRAASAIVMDSVSGRVLWQLNADVPRFPASTTKIMTALLLLERTKPTDIITAPLDIEKVKESSMHLKPGEKISAQDMLYAILLRSANDGCYATAIHVAGSEAAFARLMNERAKEIGCLHTTFNNANGLHDPGHKTTARDLALIAAEAMKHPTFRETVTTYRKKITRGINTKDQWMVNHNKRLRRDDTCDGIKTGWTVPAGRCFVGSASRENWRVITVVLKSKNWQEDTATLFDWAFKNFKRKDVISEGADTEAVPIVGGTSGAAPAQYAYGAYILETPGIPANPRIEIEPLRAEAPILVGTPVALAHLTDASGFRQTVKIVSKAEINPSIGFRAQRSAERNLSAWWLAAGAGLITYWARSRNQKRPDRTMRHG